MNRYFKLGETMAKVGSVAHQQFGQGAQQFVKAEEFDRVVEERNALQASVEQQAAELRRINWLLVMSWVTSLLLLIAIYWRLWNA